MSTKTKHDESVELEHALDQLDLDKVQVKHPSELRAIAERVDQLEAVQAEIDTAVREARAAGHPWARIALALNVSRQAAHERYSGSEDKAVKSRRTRLVPVKVAAKTASRKR